MLLPMHTKHGQRICTAQTLILKQYTRKYPIYLSPSSAFSRFTPQPAEKVDVDTTTIAQRLIGLEEALSLLGV